MSEKNANHTHPPYRKYETTAAYNLPDSKPESRQGQVVCVDGGRLQRCGKSNRSKAPADGHRSDSPGIFYKFPAQRSSGSVRVALRLSRPPGLRHARACLKIAFCKMYVTVCGKFVPKSGGVAGYAD